MSNLKKRVERLERAQGEGGVAIVIINHGETGEEAWQRYLAEHPGAEDTGAKIFIQGPIPGPPVAPTTRDPTISGPTAKEPLDTGTRSRYNN